MFTTKVENNVFCIDFKSSKPYNLFEASMFDQFHIELDHFFQSSYDGLIFKLDESFIETSNLLNNFHINNLESILKFQN